VTTARTRRPRVGVFGGTFDPPHLGHLALAERARDELDLERVLFVPAAHPPHKRGTWATPIAHRLAMTRLAVRGHRGFTVSDLEVRRAGASYTVETLRELRRRHPGTDWWLLLGEDSLRGLKRWRHPHEIAALARIAVAPRSPLPRGAGRGRADSRTPAWLRGRVRWLSSPVLEIASRDLRARARRGDSLRVLVPDTVEAYARRHRLYRRPA